MNIVHIIIEVIYLSKVIDNPQKIILNNAKKILYEDGYSKLSIRRIAKLSNMATGTIYNYYSTKKDIVMEMMMDYWEDFFKVINDIDKMNVDFYIKLYRIFAELSKFIKTFKEIWLSIDFYSDPDYLKGGMEKEPIYINRLITKMEDILKSESTHVPASIQVTMDYHEAAEFIILNLITIVQMKIFDYESFEKILKSLFSKK
jgi:AcrR family transcriptional regulator